MSKPKTPPATYTPDDIRAIRARRRLTQEEMAVALGHSVIQVKRLESGACKPRPKLLRALDDLAAKPPLPDAYTPEMLRDLRSRLRMTQRDLAAAIGHEISSVKFWETGRRKQQEPRALKALDALAAKAGMFE